MPHQMLYCRQMAFGMCPLYQSKIDPGRLTGESASNPSSEISLGIRICRSSNAFPTPSEMTELSRTNAVVPFNPSSM